jgi:signal transduction histidine kinase
LTTRRLTLGLAALFVFARAVSAHLDGVRVRFSYWILAATVLTLALTWLRPAWSRYAVRVFLLGVVGAIAAATASGPPRLVSVQPVLAYGILPVFALLLDGAVAVALVAASSVGALVWIALYVPFAGEHGRFALSNVTLGVIFASIAMVSESRGATLLRERAASVAAARDRALADIEALNRLLFSDFHTVLSGLAPLLRAADPQAQLPAVRAAAQQMRALLERGRVVVLREDAAPSLEPLAFTEPALRARGLTALVVALALGYGLAILRNVFWGGPVVASLVTLAVYLSVYLRRHRPRSVALDLLSAALLVACIHSAFSVWSWVADSPPLSYLPGLAFIVYWLLGIEGLALWASGIVLELVVVFLPRDPRSLGPAVTVLLFMLAGASACTVYWRNLRAELALLAARVAAADDATQERRRLTTTFFHDQANLVLALEGATDPEDGPPTPALFAELAALEGRMRAHLTAMGELAGSGPVPEGELKPVSVRELFDGLTLLFREPLARKRQRLVFEGDPGLRLRAVPAVLLDSVLSNLVSNAIKFTPEGGTIRLVAEARGSEVALLVRDEGAGLPPGVLSGISSLARLPSRAGSAGESGNGFGLVLARQTAQRMGGVLELGAPARGAEVLLRFPAAGG